MLTDDVKELADLIDEVIKAGQLGYMRETFFVIAAVSLLFYAVFFLLEAIGIYTINRRLGNKGAGLAFLPGIGGYALGTAADSLKKRKPSNYCIHMMMLKSFHLLVNVVYAVKAAQYLNMLYEALMSNSGADTMTVLEGVLAKGNADSVYVIAYNLSTWVGYAVTFVSLLCYARILQLFRSHNGFFLLFATIFIPQVMSVYLFAKRHADLYTKLPVFRMPRTWEERDDNGSASDDSDDADYSSDSNNGEDFSSENGYYTPPQEPSENEEHAPADDNDTDNGQKNDRDGDSSPD